MTHTSALLLESVAQMQRDRALRVRTGPAGACKKQPAR